MHIPTQKQSREAVVNLYKTDTVIILLKHETYTYKICATIFSTSVKVHWVKSQDENAHRITKHKKLKSMKTLHLFSGHITARSAFSIYIALILRHHSPGQVILMKPISNKNAVSLKSQLGGTANRREDRVKIQQDLQTVQNLAEINTVWFNKDRWMCFTWGERILSTCMKQETES